MKKVISKGYEKFIATCDKCNCTFEYELRDLNLRCSDSVEYSVDCPECGYGSDHLANVQHMRNVDAFIDSFHKGVGYEKVE